RIEHQDTVCCFPCGNGRSHVVAPLVSLSAAARIRIGQIPPDSYCPRSARLQAHRLQVFDHELRPALTPFRKPPKRNLVAASSDSTEHLAGLLKSKRLIHVSASAPSALGARQCFAPLRPRCCPLGCNGRRFFPCRPLLPSVRLPPER